MSDYKKVFSAWKSFRTAERRGNTAAMQDKDTGLFVDNYVIIYKVRERKWQIDIVTVQYIKRNL